MVAKMGLDVVTANVPTKRMGNAEDAAGVAIFLVSRASRLYHRHVVAGGRGLVRRVVSGSGRRAPLSGIRRRVPIGDHIELFERRSDVPLGARALAP